jgi:Uncharacterised protein family (UPF0203)
MGSSLSKEAEMADSSSVHTRDNNNNNNDIGTRKDQHDADKTSAIAIASVPSLSSSSSSSSSSSPAGQQPLRSGMDLVNYECRKNKRAYRKCVNTWYSKGFITGNTVSLNQEEACGDLFDTYRVCVLRGIRREFWDKEGLPPPNESSPLAEVDDDCAGEPTK